ncbi:MAG: hypothetical protein ACXVGH_10935 [Mycobacteriales bacterium]
MEHVVFFPAPDGTPAFRRVASLEDAVRLVEHLRNVEGVNEVSVHALSEVPLAFKAWYRVEVPAVEPLAPAAELAPEPHVEPLGLEVPGIVPDAVPAPVLEAVPDVVEAPAVADLPEPAELVVPEQAEHQDAQEPVVALAGEQVARPSSLGFFAS